MSRKTTNTGRPRFRAFTALAATGTVITLGAWPAHADPTPQTCSTVAHVGDSTSTSLDDPEVIPEEADRLTAKYKAAGATDVINDSQEARAILERVDAGTSGLDALNTINARTPDCYVIALGTNDAANIGIGSSVNATERIEKVLELTGDKPVLWPTLKTTEAARAVDGYDPEAMQSFNEALNQATDKHPNLTVIDWAEQADDTLFTSDGIHYTAEGSKKQVTVYADALTAVQESEPDQDANQEPAPAEPGDEQADPSPAPEAEGSEIPFYWPS